VLLWLRNERVDTNAPIRKTLEQRAWTFIEDDDPLVEVTAIKYSCLRKKFLTENEATKRNGRK